MDDMILIQVPNGDSFELFFFEAHEFVKNVLRLREEETNKIMDWVWNFYSSAIDLKRGKMYIPRKVESYGAIMEETINSMIKEGLERGPTTLMDAENANA